MKISVTTEVPSSSVKNSTIKASSIPNSSVTCKCLTLTLNTPTWYSTNALKVQNSLIKALMNRFLVRMLGSTSNHQPLISLNGHFLNTNTTPPKSRSNPCISKTSKSSGDPMKQKSMVMQLPHQRLPVKLTCSWSTQLEKDLPLQRPRLISWKSWFQTSCLIVSLLRYLRSNMESLIMVMECADITQRPWELTISLLSNMVWNHTQKKREMLKIVIFSKRMKRKNYEIKFN